MLLPINLQMDGAHILCVGGGPVAAAKVTPMVEAGASLQVISPQIVDELAAIATSHEPRPFEPRDLDVQPPLGLVVAATGVASVDDQVSREALRRGVWCLRTTGPGTAAMPAVTRRGEVTIAVTTGAPALSSALRKRLDQVIGPEWAQAAGVLAALRTDQRVRSALADVAPRERRRRWASATTVALDGASEHDVRQILTGV